MRPARLVLELHDSWRVKYLASYGNNPRAILEYSEAVNQSIRWVEGDWGEGGEKKGKKKKRKAPSYDNSLTSTVLLEPKEKMKKKTKKVHSNLTYFNHATILERTTYRSRTEKSKQERGEEEKKKVPEWHPKFAYHAICKARPNQTIEHLFFPPLPLFRPLLTLFPLTRLL